MGGIVSSRKALPHAHEHVNNENIDTRNIQQYNHTHRNEPFVRNRIRRVRSTDSTPSRNVPSTSSGSSAARPPLHPSRQNTPSTQNLSVDTTAATYTMSGTNSSHNLQQSTPRRRNSPLSGVATPISSEQLTLMSCINQTPVGDEKSKYQYYCPLCMRHFENILVVPCCTNSICFECTVEYLGSKSIEATRLEDITSNKAGEILECVACPHCCQQGFKPDKLQPTDQVKNYSITPRSCQCDRNLFNGMSPLKPGDTFERMSQKMLKFENMQPGSETKATTRAIPVDNVDVNDSRVSSSSSSPPPSTAVATLMVPEVDEDINGNFNGDNITAVATSVSASEYSSLLEVTSSTAPSPVPIYMRGIADTTASTPVRRKLVVETYVQGILCDVCEQHNYGSGNGNSNGNACDQHTRN